ncbi:MAG: DUF4145 domain-containing protein [Myxococcales bacterium]|nr:DUF4145 domain-containing protein [Myxococcales bacterium]
MQRGEWQCPACGLATDLEPAREQRSTMTVLADNASGPRSFHLVATVCPNRLCRELSLSVEMYPIEEDASGTLGEGGRQLRDWNLLPGPKGRALPHYVPEPIANEFAQASQILKLAPAASATLARRCLQALVRDFWGVKQTFLSAELEEIRERLNDETWEAIESVRSTGKIGKHFEKGTNVIVDVESNEPEMLLNLIEYLVEDWYAARRRRQQRLASIKNRSLAPPDD